MPGTIHVSVLNFKDLPSSLLPSSILIKVSMGEREHQTWGEGDFSFPLTTLRHNVTITLEDSEGNEISHTGLKTMLVVENGKWDEFLTLQGGGQVHMRLQFVLSEEERNRIRIMRESAVKKRGELLTSSLRYSETESDSSAGGSVMSSSFRNHEVSDSRKDDTRNEVVSVGDPAIHAGALQNPECASRNKKGTTIHRKEVSPIDTGGNKETSSASSMSKRMNVHLGDSSHRELVDNTETKLPLDVSKRRIFPQEDSAAKNTNLVASKLNNDEVNKMLRQKQDLLQRTPSIARTTNEAGVSVESSSAASISKWLDAHLGDVSHSKFVDKIETKLQPADISKRPMFLQQALAAKKKNLIASEVKNDGEHQLEMEKQKPKLDSLLKTPSNNNTGGNEETSSVASTSKRMYLQVGGVNHSITVEKSETELQPVDVSKRPIFSQEASAAKKKSLIASKIKYDEADQPENQKQEPLRKTPSNLRKLIGAFENSVAKDTRPGIKPPPEATNPVELTTAKLKNPIVTADLQHIQTNETRREEHVGFDKDLTRFKSSHVLGQLKEPKVTPIHVRETDSMKKMEWTKAEEDLVRISAVQAAKDSGMIHEEYSGLLQPHGLWVNQHDSSGTPVMEGRESESSSSNSYEISVQEPSEDKLDSVAFSENQHSCCEISGAWIFADHARRLCITTGSEQVVDLVEDFGLQERTHKEKKSFPLLENLEKTSVQSEHYTEVKECDSALHELVMSRVESSSQVENSTGPVGQAIKIAIMVAFGTLVLLTRQKKDR